MQDRDEPFESGQWQLQNHPKQADPSRCPESRSPDRIANDIEDTSK